MRVVIAEDSVLLRSGLTRYLLDAGFDVVAAVGDGDELVRVVAKHRRTWPGRRPHAPDRH
jgi:DNA-binding NarL/FixJ family response regulator